MNRIIWLLALCATLHTSLALPARADLGTGEIVQEELQAPVTVGRFGVPSETYNIDAIELDGQDLALSITRPTCGRAVGMTFRVAPDSRGELRGKLLLPTHTGDELYCFALVVQRIHISTREILRRARARGLARPGNSRRLNVYGSDNKIAATIVLR